MLQLWIPKGHTETVDGPGRLDSAALCREFGFARKVGGCRVTPIERRPKLLFCFVEQFLDFAAKRLIKMLRPVVSMMDKPHRTVAVDED